MSGLSTCANLDENSNICSTNSPGFTATEVGTGPAERIYASALPLLKARRALFVRQSKKRVMGDGHPNPRFGRKSSTALRTNPPMPLAIFAAMPLPWTSSFLRISLIHVYLYLDVSTAKGLFLLKLKTGYWKWWIGFYTFVCIVNLDIKNYFSASTLSCSRNLRVAAHKPLLKSLV